MGILSKVSGNNKVPLTLLPSDNSWGRVIKQAVQNQAFSVHWPAQCSIVTIPPSFPKPEIITPLIPKTTLIFNLDPYQNTFFYSSGNVRWKLALAYWENSSVFPISANIFLTC